MLPCNRTLWNDMGGSQFNVPFLLIGQSCFGEGKFEVGVLTLNLIKQIPDSCLLLGPLTAQMFAAKNKSVVSVAMLTNKLLK